MRTDVLVACVALASFAAAGCSKTAEPAPENRPAPAAAASQASASTPSVMSAAHSSASAHAAASSPLTWDVPSAWTTAPNPSPMRKATYKIPKAPGDAEDAEMSVSQAGGGVDANISRWSNQFQGAPAAKVSTRDVGGIKVTVAEAHGTFTGGGMPGSPSGPKNGWALLGAIVDAVEPPFFFKLTGPEKTVNAARPDFEKLVASFRPTPAPAAEEPGH